MNILIPNSWLKDYLETNATPQQFADAMSLTSISIEHMENVENDIVFDIEVTTNRPDLMSIEGIAREASAVLPEAGYKAVFKPHKIINHTKIVEKSPLLTIINDKTLVNRIVAVVMEIQLSPSPQLITRRLEKTGIRSINNVVDVTNYIMREVGHPSHVFDYDRLVDHKLLIRRSKKGEMIETLDGKKYELLGNDIVADNGTGKIIDLLGIMGTNNSAVTDDTKRVVLFLDNNDPQLLRKTSMGLGIRSEAAILNEKGVDPELMLPTLLRGIELLKENADGKVISDVIDIYPNKSEKKKIAITKEKIDSVIGISIPEKTIISILQNLNFKVAQTGGEFFIEPPSTRMSDIEIPEDIVEEVARVYGYHKIPNLLPPIASNESYHIEENEFYWEDKIKQALKYWGFIETYTYSMVSEELFEGPTENAITIKNPLTEDRIYMRNSLVPSLLEVTRMNNKEEMRLFEFSNIYIKNNSNLPLEIRHLAGIIKKTNISFAQVRGIVEQLLITMGIKGIIFKKGDLLGDEVDVYYKNNKLGDVEILDSSTGNFELNFPLLLEFASLKKAYKEPPKYPPIIEDVRITTDKKVLFSEVVDIIKDQDSIVKSVELLDVYGNKKTYRIYFQDLLKNLTNEDILPIRKKIYKALEKKFSAIIG